MAVPVKASWTVALFRGLAAEQPGITSRTTCPGASVERELPAGCATAAVV